MQNSLPLDVTGAVGGEVEVHPVLDHLLVRYGEEEPSGATAIGWYEDRRDG
jgi:hypothetical protein